MATKKKTRKTAPDTAPTPARAIGEASDISPGDLVPIEVPYFNAGVLQVQVTGNDFLLTFLRAHPARSKSGHAVHVAILQPVALVAVSPQTAKDMLLALTDVVAQHEQEFGEISTPFTKHKANGQRKKGH